MNYTINQAQKHQYQEIVDVWEASVRATHHFLKEEDIAYFKPLILEQYLDAVELRVVQNQQQKIVGFMGIHEQSLEMLFLDPAVIGHGIGRQCMELAFKEFEVNRVDVNEDNPSAVAFYKKMGFEVFDRSELDPQGKPFPILHMRK
ncbi:MAG: GNAT family N-acetyltransferase [Saprospiraceae bacterium]|nr:GNAT family N-acetyltransferase [Saprospiraceae bacterium]